MKKIIIFAITLLFVCGCETKKNNIICEFRSDYINNKYTSSIDISIDKNNIVNDATLTNVYDDEENANKMCNMLKSLGNNEEDLSCDGQTITIKNFHQSISKNDLSRSDIVNYFEKQGYTCQSK